MKRTPGKWWIDNNYPPAMMAAGLSGNFLMSVDAQYNIYFNDFLSCVFQIFQFSGLPETVDITYSKMCLFLAGRVCVFRDTRGSGDILALDCGTEEKRPTVYYMPDGIIIDNPAFKGYQYRLTPGKDCAVIFCREVDRYNYGLSTGGLFGLIATTAQLLADNTVSINVATKNMRLTNIIGGVDDKITAAGINEALKAMYNGEPFISVQQNLIEKLEAIPITAQTNTQQLLQLLQVRQYIYSHFYEQIGLKTHDQMKKERLITAELDEGTELAIFNLSDMIAEIQRGIDEANRIFSLEIKMYLNPLISQILEDAEETEPAPQASQPAAADSQSDAAADGVPEAAEEPTPEAIEIITPTPEPQPETAGSQSDDGSGAESDAGPAAVDPDPEQAQPPPVAISIDAAENAGTIEINVTVDAEKPEPEADPDPDEQPEGGADNGE